MQSREISPVAGIGIAVAVLATVGGLMWWRTSFGGGGDTTRYTDTVRVREGTAAEAALTGERNARKANPEGFRAAQDSERDKIPQHEETR